MSSLSAVSQLLFPQTGAPVASDGTAVAGDDFSAILSEVNAAQVDDGSANAVAGPTDAVSPAFADAEEGADIDLPPVVTTGDDPAVAGDPRGLDIASLMAAVAALDFSVPAISTEPLATSGDGVELESQEPAEAVSIETPSTPMPGRGGARSPLTWSK